MMCCSFVCVQASLCVHTRHSPHARLMHAIMYTCTEHASDYIDVQFAALEMIIHCSLSACSGESEPPCIVHNYTMSYAMRIYIYTF